MTGTREVQEWFILRDKRGLTSLPAVPGEGADEISRRVVRWLDDHLYEFTYKQLTYQIVRSDLSDTLAQTQIGRLKRILTNVPAFFWYITQGEDYVTQFPGQEGQSWQDAKRMVVQFLDSQSVAK